MASKLDAEINSRNGKELGMFSCLTATLWDNQELSIFTFCLRMLCSTILQQNVNIVQRARKENQLLSSTMSPSYLQNWMATKNNEGRNVVYRFVFLLQSKVLIFMYSLYLLQIKHCSDLIIIINKIKNYKNDTKFSYNLVTKNKTLILK